MQGLGRRLGDAVWGGWIAIARRMARRFGGRRSAMHHYARGMQLTAAGNYQQGILDGLCAIEADPQWAYGYQLLSYAYRRSGDALQAKEAAERGLTVNPRAAYLFSHHGDAEADLGHYAEAEADFRRALELLSGYGDGRPALDAADVLLRLGIAVRSQQRPTEAIDILGESLRLRPAHPRTLAEMGGAYQNLRDHQTAVQYLSQAIERDPRNAYVRFRLAENLAILGRPSDALVHARAAVEIEPGNPHYRWILEMTEKTIAT